jgi:hypothetical protein
MNATTKTLDTLDKIHGTRDAALDTLRKLDTRYGK